MITAMDEAATPTLTEDDFKALARSSPWRFQRLVFTRFTGDGRRVDAILTRPGHLTVGQNGKTHVSEGLPYTSASFNFDGSPAPKWVPRLPHTVSPTLRPDGLVDVRPEADYDDPLWGSFDWVAMLDPVELARGVTVADVTETLRKGRRTWWATVTDVGEEYAPRCSCCALLWGEVAAGQLAEEGGPAIEPAEFATSWLVGLDWETGIVVSLEPIDGNRTDLGFTVDIHDVTAWETTANA